MLEYQQRSNTLLARKLELESYYLKTNDLDSAKKVSGKVEFVTPFRYSSGSFIKILMPIGDKEYNFIYDFTPDRYIEIK